MYSLGYTLPMLYARAIPPQQDSPIAHPGGLNHSHGHHHSPLPVLPKGSLDLTSECPKSLQISVQSHSADPNWESLYRLRQQWRGAGAFSEGSVCKWIEKRVWISQCDKRLLSSLEKTLFSPDIERTIYLLLHAGKRKVLVKDKVS